MLVGDVSDARGERHARVQVVAARAGKERRGCGHRLFGVCSGAWLSGMRTTRTLAGYRGGGPLRKGYRQAGSGHRSTQHPTSRAEHASSAVDQRSSEAGDLE